MYSIYEIPADKLVGFTKEDFGYDLARDLAIDREEVETESDIIEFLLTVLNNFEVSGSYFVVSEDETLLYGVTEILNILPNLIWWTELICLS